MKGPSSSRKRGRWTSPSPRPGTGMAWTTGLKWRARPSAPATDGWTSSMQESKPKISAAGRPKEMASTPSSSPGRRAATSCCEAERHRVGSPPEVGVPHEGVAEEDDRLASPGDPVVAELVVVVVRSLAPGVASPGADHVAGGVGVLDPVERVALGGQDAQRGGRPLGRRRRVRRVALGQLERRHVVLQVHPHGVERGALLDRVAGVGRPVVVHARQQEVGVVRPRTAHVGGVGRLERQVGGGDGVQRLFPVAGLVQVGLGLRGHARHVEDPVARGASARRPPSGCRSGRPTWRGGPRSRCSRA